MSICLSHPSPRWSLGPSIGGLARAYERIYGGVGGVIVAGGGVRRPGPRAEPDLTPDEVRDVVFQPADAVSLALDTIERRRTEAGVGVRLGIPMVDDYLLPARPGELITVLGMTSNYKSGLMQHWARYTAEVIARERIEDECVVYVTWEQAIEEMLVFDFACVARLSAIDLYQGRISGDTMRQLRDVYATRRVVTPVYLIGHSLAEGRRRPRLTLTTVGRGLQLIEREWGLRPRIIFLDYLQLIMPAPGEDRRLQMLFDVNRCLDMGLAMRCPVVLGCQTGRSTYDQAWGMPNIHSGLETSGIEHASYKILGTWMPKTTYDLGTDVSVSTGRGKGSKRVIHVTENLLILKVLKQKMGPAGRWFQLYVDSSRNLITGLAEDDDGSQVP